jgi:hypothetical protein
MAEREAPFNAQVESVCSHKSTTPTTPHGVHGEKLSFSTVNTLRSTAMKLVVKLVKDIRFVQTFIVFRRPKLLISVVHVNTFKSEILP